MEKEESLLRLPSFFALQTSHPNKFFTSKHPHIINTITPEFHII